MCGIFGYTLDSRDNTPSLDVAIAQLRHRGPDGDGTFVDHAAPPFCGLAHTRLAIIDLSPSGRQPMTTPDGRYTIVFNGEIYNYRAVAKELEQAGERLVSSSDTEVLLVGYRVWGTALLERLRGMFAFAIWDAAERSLFLARDRLGVKPLYLARVGGGLVFASELRAILATNLVRRVASAGGLASFLAYGSAREPDTIVEGVEMLGAGQYAHFAAGMLVRGTYWTLPIGVDRRASRADAIEELQDLLRESVALRLVSDVPVAVFLSGGLDSSALVALASGLLPKPVNTFTVTFDEAPFDEARFAGEIAARFSADHHPIGLSAKRALDELDGALGALDQPSADGINTYFVSKAVRNAGVTVALSGIGGDELFGGYGGFRRFRRAARLSRWLSRLPLQRAPRPGLFAPIALSKAASLLETRGDPFAIYSVLRLMLGPDVRRRLLGVQGDSGTAPSAFDAAVSRWVKSRDGDSIAAFGLFELTNYLRNTLLRDADVMGMAHSLEIREPLLDHRLVERAVAVPGRMRLSRTQNKPMLADSVRDVPRSTSLRRKSGFILPFDVWLRGPLKGWALERLRQSAAFEPNELLRLWRAFEAGWLSHTRIWTLIVLVDWARRHGVEIRRHA
ncbi:MAG: asparagine synthase (glutamine-hydrolyzing) [Polyangiaceae bacterium]|nr:asparagine synthase (glutamine-hydrolyzing) [Polyangiaceae bacterium]